jgi:hypothetical protein
MKQHLFDGELIVGALARDTGQREDRGPWQRQQGAALLDGELINLGTLGSKRMVPTPMAPLAMVILDGELIVGALARDTGSKRVGGHGNGNKEQPFLMVS